MAAEALVQVNQQQIKLVLVIAETIGDQKSKEAVYKQTDVFLVVFSIQDPLTFGIAKNKWIPEIQIMAPSTPIILVALNAAPVENTYPLWSFDEALVWKFARTSVDRFFCVSPNDGAPIKQLYSVAIDLALYFAPPTLLPGVRFSPDHFCLVIELIRIDNLRPLSVRGMCHSYLVISLGDNNSIKTSVQRKTLSPQWEYVATVSGCRKAFNVPITFEVWHENHIKKDEFNGQCKINVCTILHNTNEENQMCQQTLQLTQRPSIAEKITGTLSLYIRVVNEMLSASPPNDSAKWKK